MKRLPRLLHFSGKRPHCWLLFILFPLFLNLLLYGNLLPAPSPGEANASLFAFDGPSLLRFLLSLLLVKSGAIWRFRCCAGGLGIAAALVALPLYVISMVDYYKYYSLGTRIAAEDITMVCRPGRHLEPQRRGGQRPVFSAHSC